LVPAHESQDLMRAAVTEGAGSMVVIEPPAPSAPGHGQVVIHPEAIRFAMSNPAEAMKVVIRS
jgi:hypothetical protein